MLTSQQVADRLGISVRHVSRLTRSGELAAAIQLPGIRGARLYAPDEVEQVRVMRELQFAGRNTKASK